MLAGALMSTGLLGELVTAINQFTLDRLSMLPRKREKR